MELNDEILCAYIDGELDAEMRGRVQESLATDSGACARLERMQNADTSLRDAFRMAPVKPNDSLIEYIETSPHAVSRFANRRSAVWGALAAGVSGIVLGYLLTKSVNRDEGTLLTFASSEALPTALETQLSGQTVTEHATSIAMQLSFKADDGKYCRVFRLQRDRESADGIACRDTKRWKILALDAISANGGGFGTAGASELIDGAMDHLGGGAALERQQERAMIEQHWQFNSGHADRPPIDRRR